MSLYPSLEEMKVGQMVDAQIRAEAMMAQFNNTPAIENHAAAEPGGHQMYPSIGDYMGLELSQEVIAANMPEYSTQMQTFYYPHGVNGPMLTSQSGLSVGLKRAQVTNGVRELILCKDKDNKVGLRAKSIDNGVFVCLVIDKSPAALAGLRFGDQILQLNGTNVAGFTMDKVHEMLKKSPVNGISVVVRDRPFERTITLHKDSAKQIGCLFKNGKITHIVKDSSAARNGLLINHQILEVQGQNVVGMKDKEISKLITDGEDTVVTLTIIPSYLYDHMIKKMSGSLIKNLMDHSVLNI